MTEDEARNNLRQAIQDWYATSFGGSAVNTGWYLIAKGTGYDEGGSDRAHLAQEWDADIIDQIGLIDYARERVLDRMREETQ